MIKSIYGMAFRYFKENRYVSISSVISVIIAISLTITMSMLISNADRAFREEIKKLYGNMDMLVGFDLKKKQTIDSNLLKTITSTRGIEQVSSVLLDNLNVDALNTQMYTVGVENDELVKSRYHFEFNITGHEVIINEGLAEALGVSVGEPISIEMRSFIVKEVLADISGTGTITDMLIIPRDTLESIEFEKTGIVNKANFLLIKNSPGMESIEIAKSLREIDKQFRIDIVEEQPFFAENLKSLQVFVMVLSVLVIFVTALLIISNFQTYLYKYRQQFAIMRSIGAGTKDLFKIIFIQCTIINVIGGLLGYVIAFVASKFSQIWFERLFATSVDTIKFSYGLAFIVLVANVAILELFMMIPAYRASKILPLKMLQSNDQGDFTSQKVRRRWGEIVFYTGLLILLFGVSLAKPDGTDVILTIIGLLVSISGVFVLFPFYLSPMLNRLLPMIRRIFGKVSFVAVKNVIPQVRKNTIIILILSVTMIITVFGSTLLTTIQGNQSNYIRELFPTKIVISSRVNDSSQVGYNDIRIAVEKMEGVKVASTLSTYNDASLMNYDKSVSISYYLADLKEMMEQKILPSYSGTLDNVAYISQKFANQYKIQEGDLLDLGFYSNDQQTDIPVGQVKVVEIVDNLPGYSNDVFMDWSNTTFVKDTTSLGKVFVSTSLPVEQVTGNLESLKGQFPGLQIDNYEQTLYESNQMFYQRWSLFIIVLIVMLGSVLVGVINSLINNIHSKRKELSVLRTLSVTRSGIARVIMTQVIMYIVIGLILGGVLGMLLSYGAILIDPSGLTVNYRVMGGVAALILASVSIVLLPYSVYLGRRSLPRELTQEG